MKTGYPADLNGHYCWLLPGAPHGCTGAARLARLRAEQGDWRGRLILAGWGGQP